MLGKRHPDISTSLRILDSFNLLATIIRDRDKYEAAKEMKRRALTRYEKVLSFGYPDMLTGVSSLASMLQIRNHNF